MQCCFSPLNHMGAERAIPHKNSPHIGRVEADIAANACKLGEPKVLLLGVFDFLLINHFALTSQLGGDRDGLKCLADQ